LTAKLVISDHTQLGSIGTNTHAEIDTSIANTIHKNIAAEISTVPLKLAPVSADLLLIEDSEDSYNKKAVLRSTMDYKQQVVTVAKAGGQFTSIQAAIDWITDESGSKRYIVEIAPGEYNENVVLPGWISLKGMGKAHEVVIWSNTGDVLAMTGALLSESTISNLTLRAAPTAPGCRLFHNGVGVYVFARTCRLEYSPTGTYGTAIQIDLGSLEFSEITCEYTQTGVGGGPMILVHAGTWAGAIGISGTLTMTVQADETIYGYRSLATLPVAADIDATKLRITASHASYSSNCYGIHHTGTANRVHFTAGQLELTATGGSVTGTGTAVYLDNGAAKLSSIASQIAVDGFANNYVANLVQAGDILYSHFDLHESDDDVIGAGTYTYVNTDEAGNIQVSGSYLNMYDRALTVGARGADHTSIQDAIDAITDAAADKQYVILIYPGEYAETIVGKDYVGLKGIGNTHDVIVSGATGPLYTFPEFGGDVSKIFEVPAAKADSVEIKDCHFHVSSATNGIVSTVVDANGSGILTFLRCQVDYAMTGSLAGSLGHFIFDMGGSTQYNVVECQINVSIADVNDYLEVFLDSSTSSAPCVISHNYVSVSMTGSNLGGAWFLDLTGGPGDRTLQANFVTMNCSGGATANVGEIYYTNSGTATIHSSSNRFNVTGFTSNYFADLANAGDTLESQFDDIIAADGVTGSGTYQYANSPAEQEFHCEYINTYHIGVGSKAAGTGHLILAEELYTGSGNKVGMGMFPTYQMAAAPATGNLYGVQGNVFFGGNQWLSNSNINALQFYPAPDYQFGSSSWGNAYLNLIGITTGGFINVLFKTVVANALLGLQVQTFAHIFGGAGSVTADRATAIEVGKPSQGSGTIGEQCGIEVRKQEYGTQNCGMWLQGEGVGADLSFGRGTVVSGVGDALTLVAPGFGPMRITDSAAAFLSGMVGRSITITGATNPINNGTFTVTRYISATQIEYANVGASQAVWVGTWSLPYAPANARMYYDGTDFVIDPDNVGSGIVLIGTTGDDDIKLNNIEIDGALNHDGTTAGFYGTAPVTKPTALTTALTQITHTGPTTPDYAIATPVDSGVGSAWGFSTQDEFETVMSVVLNLQTRVDELETKLQGLGLLT
jgi:hypothetical protein